MNVIFRIQKGQVNKQGKSVVMVDMSWHGERVFVSSRRLVNPAAFIPCWPKKEQPQDGQFIHSAEENSVELNEYFSRLKTNIEEGFLELERVCGRKKPITPDMVRAMVKDRTGASVSSLAHKLIPTKNIWTYHEEWKTSKRHKYSKSHLRRFNKVWQWLDEYAPEMDLNVLDEAWVQDYANWMLETPNPFTGAMPHDGTIGRHIRFFRTMLKFARMPYRWLENIAVTAMPMVTLSYPELLAIHQTVFADPQLRHTVAQYILLTQLNLYYSDLVHLTNDAISVVNVNGKFRLALCEFRQTKRFAPLNVRFPDLAEEIWLRYGGNLEIVPKQEFNQRLKVVGFVAQLDREVALNTVSSKHGCLPEKLHLPLWQLLTARTARHTCASLVREGSRSIATSQA